MPGYQGSNMFWAAAFATEAVPVREPDAVLEDCLYGVLSDHVGFGLQ